MSGLSREARALLEQVRNEEGPSAEQRAALRRGVFGAMAAGGTLLGGSGAAAGATASKLSSFAVLAGKLHAAPLSIWFLIGTLGAVVAVAPSAAYRYVATRAHPTTTKANSENIAASRLALPPRALPPPPVAGSTPANPMANAVPPEPTTVPGPGVTGRKGRESEAPRALGSTGIAVELELLGAAQRELAAGRAAFALEHLAEHERRFPRSALTGERLGAKVFALCALGRSDEARRVKTEFLLAAPGSPLTPRVLASCGGPPSAGVSQDRSTESRALGHEEAGDER